jgi:uncharacterized protein (DUF1330 family)
MIIGTSYVSISGAGYAQGSCVVFVRGAGAREEVPMEVKNAVYPAPEQAAAFFGGVEDGPFIMVNLLKFREKAAYADGSDPHLSGREAYERYGVAVAKLIADLGGRIHYLGAVTGLMIGEVADLWDTVALVEYPSLAAFRAMATSAEMHAIDHHRSAGLAGQLNIKTKPRALASAGAG